MVLVHGELLSGFVDQFVDRKIQNGGNHHGEHHTEKEQAGYCDRVQG